MIEPPSGETLDFTERLLSVFGSLHGAFLNSTLDQALQLASAILARSLGMKRIAVFDQNIPDPEIIGLFGWGSVDEGIRRLLSNLARSRSAGQALNERQAVFVPDVWADQLAIVGGEERYGIRAMLFCPLIASGKIAGILLADQGGTDFSLTREEIVLAQVLTGQMAVALQHSRLRAQSEERTNSLAFRAAEQESRLRESVNRLRAAIDLLPAMVFEIDRHLTVRLANARGASFYGLEPSWMTGWQMEELTAFVKDHGWGVGRVLAIGEPCHISNLPVASETGVLDYWDVQYLPVKNSQGDLEGVAIYALDVTQSVQHGSRLEQLFEQFQNHREAAQIRQEQSQTEESPQELGPDDLLKRVFSEVPVAMAVVQWSDLRYVLANAAYEAIGGPGRGDLCGQTVVERFPELAELYVQVLSELSQTGEGVLTGELPLAEAGQETSYWDWVHVPLHGADGLPQAILIVGIDVTAKARTRLHMEQTIQTLREVNDQLAAEAAEAGEAANQERVRAQQAEQATIRLETIAERLRGIVDNLPRA